MLNLDVLMSSSLATEMLGKPAISNKLSVELHLALILSAMGVRLTHYAFFRFAKARASGFHNRQDGINFTLNHLRLRKFTAPTSIV